MQRQMSSLCFRLYGEEAKVYPPYVQWSGRVDLFLGVADSFPSDLTRIVGMGSYCLVHRVADKVDWVQISHLILTFKSLTVPSTADDVLLDEKTSESYLKKNLRKFIAIDTLAKM